jgi:hypothetical protein
VCRPFRGRRFGTSEPPNPPGLLLEIGAHFTPTIRVPTIHAQDANDQPAEEHIVKTASFTALLVLLGSLASIPAALNFSAAAAPADAALTISLAGQWRFFAALRMTGGPMAFPHQKLSKLSRVS